MRYLEWLPPAGLRPVVHRVWSLQAPGGPSGAEFQRAMPDGRAEIVFNLGDPFESRGPGKAERQPRALLIGPTTRAMELRSTGRIDLVGLRLRPGAAPVLLGIPGRELLNGAVDLRDLGLGWTRHLQEQLAECRSVTDRIELLQGRLVGRGAPTPADPRLEAGVDLVLRSRGPVGVRRIAALVGLSARQLSRICRERVGMGPKLLGRLARFQRVLRELEHGTEPGWTALAARHGYFDQAHLARDFRQFAGVSPGRYFLAARDMTRHFIDGGEPGPGSSP